MKSLSNPIDFRTFAAAVRAGSCAAAMTLLFGCGGGGDGGAAAAPASAAPAPAQRTVREEGCTNAATQTFVGGPFNSEAPGSLQETGGSEARFLFKAPATSEPMIHACAVERLDKVYKSPPADLVTLLAGNQVIVNLRMAGDIDAFTDKKLWLRAPTRLIFLSDAELATYHIVAYTQDASGVWKREPLVTTFVPPRGFEAPVTTAGYYTVE
jgi:hypothetical protein